MVIILLVSSKKNRVCSRVIARGSPTFAHLPLSPAPATQNLRFASKTLKHAPSSTSTCYIFFPSFFCFAFYFCLFVQFSSAQMLAVVADGMRIIDFSMFVFLRNFVIPPYAQHCVVVWVRDHLQRRTRSISPFQPTQPTENQSRQFGRAWMMLFFRRSQIELRVAVATTTTTANQPTVTSYL